MFSLEHAILPYERIDVASPLLAIKSLGYYPIIAHGDSPWSGKTVTLFFRKNMRSFTESGIMIWNLYIYIYPPPIGNSVAIKYNEFVGIPKKLYKRKGKRFRNADWNHQILGWEVQYIHL